MNGKTRKIFVACTVGAVMGAYFTYFLPILIWWVGAVAGGLIAGFIFALPDIIYYSPLAARTAWRSLTYTPKIWRGIVTLSKATYTLTKAAWRAPALKKWETGPYLMMGVSFVLWFANAILFRAEYKDIIYWSFLFPQLILHRLPNQHQRL